MRNSARSLWNFGEATSPLLRHGTDLFLVFYIRANIIPSSLEHILSLTFHYLHFFSLDSNPIYIISNVISAMKLFLHSFYLAYNAHFEYNSAKNLSALSPLGLLTNEFFMLCGAAVFPATIQHRACCSIILPLVEFLVLP